MIILIDNTVEQNLKKNFAKRGGVRPEALRKMGEGLFFSFLVES